LKYPDVAAGVVHWDLGGKTCSIPDRKEGSGRGLGAWKSFPKEGASKLIKKEGE